MDARLRQLKRQAESDPQYWQHYARELERSLAGDNQFQPIEAEGQFCIHHEDAVAYATYQEDYRDDPQMLGSIELELESCGTVGWYITVNWRESWGDEETEREIEDSLSEGFKALLAAAQTRGYQHIILWTP